MVSAAPGKPGWFELRIHGENQPRVLVKFEPHKGRALLTRLIVAGQLDSQTLKAIPLGRVESAANHPEYGPMSERALTEPLPPDVLDRMADREILFPKEFSEIEGALNRYLEKSAGQLKNAMTFTRRSRPREPLARPDGTDPDAFSLRVAKAYNALVVTTSAPAKAIADEAGVPVGTVHRWIREARQRGHLPPARKGRAG